MAKIKPELIFRQLTNTSASRKWAKAAFAKLTASGGFISRREMFGHPNSDNETQRSREKLLLGRLISAGVVIRKINSGGVRNQRYQLADPRSLQVLLDYIDNKPVYFNRHGLGNNCELTAKAQAIITGLLLGDGFYAGKKYSASLVIGQQDTHLDWLDLVEAQLKAEGFHFLKRNFRAAHARRVKTGAMSGQLIRAHAFVKTQTLFYRTLRVEFLRWYPNGRKIIPLDIKLTDPMTLAHWYMGDGSVNTGPGRLQIQLATNCFCEQDVCRLADQLANMGINSTISHWRIQPVLCIRHRNAKAFLEIVSPYLTDSFRYKDPVDPWKPATCKICSADIPGRTRNARYCDVHAPNRRIRGLPPKLKNACRDYLGRWSRITSIA